MKRVIVITGGSDGLGKNLASTFRGENQVIILSKEKANLSLVAQEIGCDFISCDVTQEISIKQAITYIIKKYSKIDVLINNAGILIEGKLEENDSLTIQNVIDVNLLGTIYMTKNVIPYMKKEENGIIININSQGGIGAKAEHSIYNASKWGVTGFTKSIQLELAPYGIRVTDIFPGRMKTGFFEKVGVNRDMSVALELNEMARVILFLIETPKEVFIPEINIKNIAN